MMIRVQQKTTIREIKDIIEDIEGLPSWSQYLVSKGKKLEEQRCVLDYGLDTQSYIHVLRLSGVVIKDYTSSW